MTLTLHEKLYRFFHEMDFKSQDRAAKIYRLVIVITAIVPFIILQISYMVASYFQKFSICIYSVLVATGICILMIVPGGLPIWTKTLPQFARQKDKKQKRD